MRESYFGIFMVLCLLGMFGSCVYTTKRQKADFQENERKLREEWESRPCVNGLILPTEKSGYQQCPHHLHTMVLTDNGVLCNCPNREIEQ